jgi:alkenylglycerophosphocholine hydrolase
MKYDTEELTASGKIIYLIFFIFFLSYISTLQYRPYPFSYIVKVIPILSLSLISLLNIPGKRGKFLFAGLMFSAIGDFFLALEGNRYFIFGLGAFAFAHIMYILALFKNIILKRKRSVFSLIFIIYGFFIEYLLFPNLGRMMIPATVYLSLLMFVGISSVIGKDNNILIISGAMLFMISDSIVAVNTFMTKIPHSSFWIMVTYFPAQFLIIYGSAKIKSDPNMSCNNC